MKYQRPRKKRHPFPKTHDCFLLNAAPLCYNTGSNLYIARTFPIPSFPSGDAPTPAEALTVSTNVLSDADGYARSVSTHLLYCLR